MISTHYMQHVSHPTSDRYIPHSAHSCAFVSIIHVITPDRKQALPSFEAFCFSHREDEAAMRLTEEPSFKRKVMHETGSVPAGRHRAGTWQDTCITRLAAGATLHC